jgi:hypothetical protein
LLVVEGWELGRTVAVQLVYWYTDMPFEMMIMSIQPYC